MTADPWPAAWPRSHRCHAQKPPVGRPWHTGLAPRPHCHGAFALSGTVASRSAQRKTSSRIRAGGRDIGRDHGSSGHRSRNSGGRDGVNRASCLNGARGGGGVGPGGPGGGPGAEPVRAAVPGPGAEPGPGGGRGAPYGPRAGAPPPHRGTRRVTHRGTRVSRHPYRSRHSRHSHRSTGPQRIRVAHSCTFLIRSRSCPAVASALGGPPQTRRSSVWITPCGLPL